MFCFHILNKHSRFISHTCTCMQCWRAQLAGASHLVPHISPYIRISRYVPKQYLMFPDEISRWRMACIPLNSKINLLHTSSDLLCGESQLFWMCQDTLRFIDPFHLLEVDSLPWRINSLKEIRFISVAKYPVKHHSRSWILEDSRATHLNWQIVSIPSWNLPSPLMIICVQLRWSLMYNHWFTIGKSLPPFWWHWHYRIILRVIMLFLTDPIWQKLLMYYTGTLWW